MSEAVGVEIQNFNDDLILVSAFKDFVVKIPAYSGFILTIMM
ncbi:MAG: hypothetical protein QXO15_09580 [Nitrososphaerota archaeon]